LNITRSLRTNSGYEPDFGSNGRRETAEVHGQVGLEYQVVGGVDNSVTVEIKSRVVTRQGLLEWQIVRCVDDLVAVDVAVQAVERLRCAADAAPKQAQRLVIKFRCDRGGIADGDGVGTVGNRAAEDAVTAEGDHPLCIVGSGHRRPAQGRHCGGAKVTSLNGV
jgi:hypothetical protein